MELLSADQLRAQAKRRKDFEDFQKEAAGLDTGQMPRFFSRIEIERNRTGQDHPEREDAHSRLAKFIKDQTLALYLATERAIEDALWRVKQSEKRLAAMRVMAVKTADGRAVYRTEDQKRAFFDDGTELTAAEMAEIRWTPGAPTWEQRQAAGQALTDAIKIHDVLEGYKDRLDYYNAVLSDEDLAEIARDIEAMPPMVRASLTDAAIADVSKIRHRAPRSPLTR